MCSTAGLSCGNTRSVEVASRVGYYDEVVCTDAKRVFLGHSRGSGLEGAALYVGSWSEWCRNPWPREP